MRPTDLGSRYRGCMHGLRAPVGGPKRRCASATEGQDGTLHCGPSRVSRVSHARVCMLFILASPQPARPRVRCGGDALTAGAARLTTSLAAWEAALWHPRSRGVGRMPVA